MRKTFIFLLLSTLLPLVQAGGFNVKDFGAKGDGKTDDTAAIQKAINAAGKSVKIRRSFGSHPVSSYYGSGAAVTFPGGVYKITRTIKLPSYVSLKGNDAIPMLEWHGGENDNGIMFNVHPFRTWIEKLIFVGGKVQLLLSNPNVDKTLVTIRDCQFFYAESFAVEMIPRKQHHMSSWVCIENCLFSKNFRCVKNAGDMMLIRGGWIDLAQPQMADGAALVNTYGTLRMEFCCLVPSANPEKGPNYYHNARWVDNYWRFEAESVRFGGEGGGIPAVYNYAGLSPKHPYTGAAGRVCITNSLLTCGAMNRENGGAVRLFNIPSQLILENNYSIAYNPLVVPDPSLDVESILKKNPKGAKGIKWRFVGNAGGYPDKLIVPKTFRRFCTPDSDCKYGEVEVRPVPKEITRPEQKK